MTRNIRRILHDVIKEMQLDGYPISARVGDKQINSKVANVDSWEFIFEVKKSKKLQEDKRRDVFLFMIIAFPSTQDSEDVELYLEKWEYCDELETHFINALYNYEHEDVKLIENISDLDTVEFEDLPMFEKPLTGIKTEMTIRILSTKWC